MINEPSQLEKIARAAADLVNTIYEFDFDPETIPKPLDYLDDLLVEAGYRPKPPALLEWPCSCVICGLEVRVKSVSREAAWDKLWELNGWAIRSSLSGEHFELLCPKHIDVPKGHYEA